MWKVLERKEKGLYDRKEFNSSEAGITPVEVKRVRKPDDCNSLDAEAVEDIV